MKPRTLEIKNLISYQDLEQAFFSLSLKSKWAPSEVKQFSPGQFFALCDAFEIEITPSEADQGVDDFLNNLDDDHG